MNDDKKPFLTRFLKRVAEDLRIPGCAPCKADRKSDIINERGADDDTRELK